MRQVRWKLHKIQISQIGHDRRSRCKGECICGRRDTSPSLHNSLERATDHHLNFPWSKGLGPAGQRPHPCKVPRSPQVPSEWAKLAPPQKAQRSPSPFAESTLFTLVPLALMSLRKPSDPSTTRHYTSKNYTLSLLIPKKSVIHSFTSTLDHFPTPQYHKRPE